MDWLGRCSCMSPTFQTQCTLQSSSVINMVSKMSQYDATKFAQSAVIKASFVMVFSKKKLFGEEKNLIKMDKTMKWFGRCLFAARSDNGVVVK